MKHLDSTATKIFRKLTEDLPIGKDRKIDNGPFMAVHIEKLARNMFSIAHYFEQNGDLCCDPDMTFKIVGGKVEVCEFQQAIPFVYHRVGSITEKQVRSMVSFANMWMRNIQEQQELEV